MIKKRNPPTQSFKSAANIGPATKEEATRVSKKPSDYEYSDYYFLKCGLKKVIKSTDDIKKIKTIVSIRAEQASHLCRFINYHTLRCLEENVPLEFSELFIGIACSMLFESIESCAKTAMEKEPELVTSRKKCELSLQIERISTLTNEIGNMVIVSIKKHLSLYFNNRVGKYCVAALRKWNGVEKKFTMKNVRESVNYVIEKFKGTEGVKHPQKRIDNDLYDEADRLHNELDQILYKHKDWITIEDLADENNYEKVIKFYHFIQKKLVELNVSGFSLFPVNNFETRLVKIKKKELRDRHIKLSLRSMFTKEKRKQGILCDSILTDGIQICLIARHRKSESEIQRIEKLILAKKEKKENGEKDQVKKKVDQTNTIAIKTWNLLFKTCEEYRHSHSASKTSEITDGLLQLDL